MLLISLGQKLVLTTTFPEPIFEASALVAIYNRILNSNIANLGVTCKTGNYTWPVMLSLGICGSCTPQMVITSCITGGECVYTLPSGTNAAVANGTDLSLAFQSTVLSPSESSYNPIYPGVLVLLSIVFFVINVTKTTMSSPLAMLFMDVDKSVRERLGNSMDKPGGLAVGKTNVVLEKEQRRQGWVFRAA